MKRFICLCLALVMILGLMACGGANKTEADQGGAQAAAGLQVGFGRESVMPTDITKVHLAGGDASKRIADSVKDNLYVTCVALKEGDQTILLYTMDIITADDPVVDPIKATVSVKTGIPQENILMNATHTHGSISIRSDWDGVQEYRRLFQESMVYAAEAAIKDLSPAEVYYGGVQTENMAFVRHYKLSDGSYAGSNFGNFGNGAIVGHSSDADGELQLVNFVREGKKNVLLASFPAHATFASTNDTYISADFPSPTRTYIENNSDTLVAYFIAAAGDQVPTSRIENESPYRGDYQSYGQALGKYAVDALPNLTKMADTTMKLQTKTVTYNSNKDKLELLPYTGVVISTAKKYGNIANETVTVARENGFSSYFEASAIKNRASFPPTKSMDLRTMTIGNLGFAIAPYEMFGTQGVYIKDNAPCDMTFIITCSEGAMGYLPSKLGVEIGCYEACVSEYEYGTAEKLAEDFVNMLTEMKK